MEGTRILLTGQREDDDKSTSEHAESTEDSLPRSVEGSLEIFPGSKLQQETLKDEATDV